MEEKVGEKEIPGPEYVSDPGGISSLTSHYARKT
jgi:hypothetical protein